MLFVTCPCAGGGDRCRSISAAPSVDQAEVEVREARALDNARAAIERGDAPAARPALNQASRTGVGRDRSGERPRRAAGARTAWVARRVGSIDRILGICGIGPIRRRIRSRVPLARGRRLGASAAMRESRDSDGERANPVSRALSSTTASWEIPPRRAQLDERSRNISLMRYRRLI
jgi:hypothetical protein